MNNKRTSLNAKETIDCLSRAVSQYTVGAARHLFTPFVLLLAGLLLPVTGWSASDWTPQLLSPEESVEPRDPIRIALPSPVDITILRTITVDLDGVDVSSLAKVERGEDGFVISVVPPQALSAGAHRLRLVEYHPEGDIIERGIFNLQVKEALRVLVGANMTLEGSSRVDEEGLGDLGGEEQGSGSVQLGGLVEGDGWEAGAEASVVYDSLGLNTQALEGTSDPREDEDDVDLGEYLIQTRSRRLSGMVGHHALDRQSLVMRDFHRRGISLTGQTHNQVLAASLFSFRTEPITGAHHFFGIEDSEDRVYGAVASTKPIPGHGNALTMSGLWLHGEGRDQSGVGVDGDVTRSEGDAYSVIAESRLVNDRIRFRSEYAHSDYRFDALNPLSRERNDEAYSVLAEFVPWRRAQEDKTPGQWVIGSEYQHVGLFFASPANPVLPSDKELLRGYTSLQFGNFTLQGAYAEEEDNVDDNPILPTIETQSGEVALFWTQEMEFDESGEVLVPWYGIPSISLSYQDIHQELLSAPAGFNFDIDQEYSNAQVDFSFQYNKWAWSVGYGYGDEEDLTNAAPDRRNQLLTASLSLQPWDRLSITTVYQYNRLEDQDNDIRQNTHLLNVDFNLEIVKDRLVLSGYGSVSTDDNSSNTLDTESYTVGGDISWQVIKNKPNRPGMTLWLRGERRELDDRLNPANDDEQYQVFVGISIGWSPTYRRP